MCLLWDLSGGRKGLLRSHIGVIIMSKYSLSAKGFIWAPQRTGLAESIHAEWVSSPCRAPRKLQLLAFFHHSEKGHLAFQNWPHVAWGWGSISHDALYHPWHLAILSALMSQHQGEGKSSLLGSAPCPHNNHSFLKLWLNLNCTLGKLPKHLEIMFMRHYILFMSKDKELWASFYFKTNSHLY